MSERLSKHDWVKHGLIVLARDGIGAIKPGPLAKELSVSRGSFYWHFVDVADFRGELLNAWARETTDRVIEEGPDLPGRERLRALIKRAFHTDRALDRAVRSWATQDPAATKQVGEVDKRRIAHIAILLLQAGLDQQHAAERAQFLYWAYLGQPLVIAPEAGAVSDEALEQIAQMLER